MACMWRTLNSLSTCRALARRAALRHVIWSNGAPLPSVRRFTSADRRKRPWVEHRMEGWGHATDLVTVQLSVRCVHRISVSKRDCLRAEKLPRSCSYGLLTTPPSMSSPNFNHHVKGSRSYLTPSIKRITFVRWPQP